MAIFEINAKIGDFKYRPVMCKQNLARHDSIQNVFSSSSPSIFKHSSGLNFSISRWVSPKRTRSYPFTRVYDSFGVAPSTKILTVIPVVKDEGRNGDRDFLQYDTISMMSLIGVYAIISYYDSAIKSDKPQKITNQQFNYQQITQELEKLTTYSGSVVEWNREQLAHYLDLAETALDQYGSIGSDLGVAMHSRDLGMQKLHEMFNNPGGHSSSSRKLAERAQIREVEILHADEKVVGEKAILNINDHMGGIYHLTTDECEIDEEKLFLIEAKNSGNKRLPTLINIKDGLFKMMLFTNIKNAAVGDIPLTPHAVLKLTSDLSYSKHDMSNNEIRICEKLNEEAKLNGFSIQLPSQIE